MPWKMTSIGLMLALSLAGCSSKPESEPATQAQDAAVSDGRCDAAGGQFAVGQQASAALLAQAKIKAGAQEARFLTPNDVVTLEYRSTRVNLNTDAAGKVVRINCG